MLLRITFRWSNDTICCCNMKRCVASFVLDSKVCSGCCDQYCHHIEVAFTNMLFMTFSWSSNDNQMIIKLLSNDYQMTPPYSAAIWSGVLPALFLIASFNPGAAVSAAITSGLPSQNIKQLLVDQSTCTLFRSSMKWCAAISVSCVDVDAWDLQKLSDDAQFAWQLFWFHMF